MHRLSVIRYNYRMADSFKCVVVVPSTLNEEPGLGQRVSRNLLEKLATKINDRAQGRQMLGQIDPPIDGRTRINDASHVVLPTARVKGRSLLVDIEVLDTEAGKYLRAMLEGGIQRPGVLRGVGATIEDVSVSGVDVLLDPSNYELRTVLDDIVEAVEDAEDKTGRS